ncbi:argininosuccinate synthetase [Lecanora helva]
MAKGKILVWLKEQGYDVVCFMADVGQEEDFEAAKKKALKIGAEKVYVEDLREEFIEKYCWPEVGTSLARPVIAKAQIEVAKKENCVAVSHGCTGKGNDQVRFELAFYALQPSIKVIAPWRNPEFYDRFPGRQALLDYAAEKGIPVTSTKSKPWSMDENLAHCSYEAGILEDPNTTPPSDMWQLTTSPLSAPSTPQAFTLHFAKGIPSKLEYIEENGQEKTITKALDLFLAVNAIAKKHGVGRIDIYETPGLTCLRSAHIDLEGLVMDREVRSLRDTFVTPAYSKALYNGLYFSPEREYLHDCVVASQGVVNGRVRCRVYKGLLTILGRDSTTEKLYDMDESSMDAIAGFSPQDTAGFIGVQAIRLKKYGSTKAERGEEL